MSAQHQLTSSGNPVSNDSGNSIDFVEGVRVRINPAPIPKRAAAFLADLGLITAATYILFYLCYIVGLFMFGMTAAAFKDSIPAKIYGYLAIGMVVLVVLGLTLATHAYFIYMENKYGHTFGKKIFGLRVVSADGRRLKMSQLIIRDLVRWYVDMLFLLPGLISMLVTEKKQRTGDLAAGTMVIYSKDKELENQYLYMSRNHYKRLLNHVGITPFPDSLRSSVLQYAFRTYKKGAVPNPEEIKAWAEKCKAHMPAWEKFNLNDETIIKYFAEHCYQTANANN